MANKTITGIDALTHKRGNKRDVFSFSGVEAQEHIDEYMEEVRMTKANLEDYRTEASASAQTANKSATAADKSAQEAKNSASAAAQSATASAESATASDTSAKASAASASAAANSESKAKGYADRTAEVEATLAKAEKTVDEANATATKIENMIAGAEEAATTATTAATTATNSANDAISALYFAREAESAAKASATAAKSSETLADQYSQTAVSSADNAKASETASAKSATASADSAAEAQKWAEAAAGATAGVATWNSRSGNVTPQAGDYTADMVGAVSDATYEAKVTEIETAVNAKASQTDLDSLKSTVESINVIAPLNVTKAPSVVGKGVAIGNGAKTPLGSAVAIGDSAVGNGSGAVAVGNSSTTSGAGSMALGGNASAQGAGAIAIGHNSVANESYVVSVGGGNGNSATRRIINVTNPTGAQDAATKNYVDTAVSDMATGTALTALTSRVSTNETNIETIQTDLTSVVGKVTTLIGSDSSKSVRAIAIEALTAALIPSTAQASMDTLEEIAAWIQEHPDDAAAMSQAIEALKTRMTSAESSIALKAAQADLETVIADVATKASASDLTALTKRVAANETGKADKATTLAGYGVTDAYTKTETDTALSTKADSTTVETLQTEGKFTVSASAWSSTTVTANGGTYYTYTLSCEDVTMEHPIIGISGVTDIPTVDEQTAYDCLSYAVADTTANTITLYAETLPTVSFYIIVKGAK